MSNQLVNQLLGARRTSTQSGKPTIWFDNPYNLYLREEQATKYLDIINEEEFSASLHNPVVHLMNQCSDEIVKNIKSQNEIELYDLGPGLPTKTLPLLNALKQRTKNVKYIPVDISRHFLKIATEAVAHLDIDVSGMHCLFEELRLRIEPTRQKNLRRIFLIGLTFNNYRPNIILSLLKSLTEYSDFSIIITEFYGKDKKETILDPYKERYSEDFNFLLLDLLGFHRKDFEYVARYNNSRIEMGFILRRDLLVSNKSLKKGTTIITALSYRYTPSNLDRYISNHFPLFLVLPKIGDIALYKLYNKNL